MSKPVFKYPPLPWDDHDMDNNVTGSGAEMWPWYATVIEFNQTQNAYRVDMWRKDDDEHTTTFTFTREQVAEQAHQIILGATNCNNAIVYAFQNDDVDAVAMDALIQLVVYGEIVYG